MKKKFLYIVIIIALVGLFYPKIRIVAAEQLGVCTDISGEQDPRENVTEKDCTTNGPVWRWSFYYTLLAPLPCEDSTPGCDNEKLTTFNPTGIGGGDSLSSYLNLMISLFIGICAVLAVIMIVMGGIEYMTSELISGKAAGRDRIKNSIFGLILALGAWTILNQINPNLLNTSLDSLKEVIVVIENFEISETQSIDGKSGTKVSFKAEACPAAKAAEAATGVNKALILSIFAQESSGGLNTGGCSSNGSSNSKGKTANMFPGDKEKLETILDGMGKTPPANVSCGAPGGHGGAMGVMQVLPSTWLANGGAGKNPWNTGDAMMVAATYLKGSASPYEAACKYFGGCVFNEVDYARQVVNRMENIKAQIAKDGC